MPLDTSNPPSKVRAFVRTWRREIIRGGLMFGLVLFVGLALSRAHSGIHAAFPQLDNLSQLRDLGNFDLDPESPLFGAGREVGDRWEWRGAVKPGQQVWIRNTNGPIEVVQGTGNQVEVIAEKSWHRSSPDQVQLISVPSEQGVTVCAVWKARESVCGDRGDYQQRDIRNNDVAVRFSVQLPRGVRLDVSTVNGRLLVDGATAGVQMSTVNGKIALHRAVGPVKAETVNGGVEAQLDAVGNGDVELETVNGSVTAIVPARVSALLEAETVSGRVETELPIQMTGKISPRHVHGTIGGGGSLIKLTTVNGSIHVLELGRAPVAPPVPPTPRPDEP